jgi:hypothetical protein
MKFSPIVATFFAFQALASNLGCGSPTASSGGSATLPASPPATNTTLPAAGSAALPSTTTGVATGAAGTPATTVVAMTPAANAAGAAAPPVTSTTGDGPTLPPTAANDAVWCGVKQTLDTHCTVCHNEMMTAGAPMPLKTYADTQAVAVSDKSKKVFQMIGMRVHDAMRPMPPQDKLTASELSGIDAWIAAGAPSAADPTCAAANGGSPTGATTPSDDWAWPTNCDATYKIMIHGDGGVDTPYMVPAGQEMHPQIAVQAPWNNEEVQMIAWRAITDNAKVLHHWILYGPSREHLVGWAPGKEHNAEMPADVGMHMPGGNLTLDVHFNNLTGTTAEADHSGIEMCVLKKEHFRAKTAATFTGFTQFAINIPPHATNVDVTANCAVSMTQPVTLLSASPHAHKLANHMKFTVQSSGGGAVVMHDAPFDFNEQGTFPLDKPIELKAGDTVTTTCTFSNPGNTTVTFGESTEDEMCFNFAVYYPMNALSCGIGGVPGGGIIPGF